MTVDQSKAGHCGSLELMKWQTCYAYQADLHSLYHHITVKLTCVDECLWNPLIQSFQIILLSFIFLFSVLTTGCAKAWVLQWRETNTWQQCCCCVYVHSQLCMRSDFLIYSFLLRPKLQWMIIIRWHQLLLYLLTQLSASQLQLASNCCPVQLMLLYHMVHLYINWHFTYSTEFMPVLFAVPSTTTLIITLFNYVPWYPSIHYLNLLSPERLQRC